MHNMTIPPRPVPPPQPKTNSRKTFSMFPTTLQQEKLLFSLPQKKKQAQAGNVSHGIVLFPGGLTCLIPPHTLTPHISLPRLAPLLSAKICTLHTRDRFWLDASTHIRSDEARLSPRDVRQVAIVSLCCQPVCLVSSSSGRETLVKSMSVCLSVCLSARAQTMTCSSSLSVRLTQTFKKVRQDAVLRTPPSAYANKNRLHPNAKGVGRSSSLS